LGRSLAGCVALVALWLTQIALAAMFLFVGGLKLTGAPELLAVVRRDSAPGSGSASQSRLLQDSVDKCYGDQTFSDR
jgi:hypothetical protein